MLLSPQSSHFIQRFAGRHHFPNPLALHPDPFLIFQTPPLAFCYSPGTLAFGHILLHPSSGHRSGLHWASARLSVGWPTNFHLISTKWARERLTVRREERQDVSHIWSVREREERERERERGVREAQQFALAFNCAMRFRFSRLYWLPWIRASFHLKSRDDLFFLYSDDLFFLFSDDLFFWLSLFLPCLSNVYQSSKRPKLIEIFKCVIASRNVECLISCWVFFSYLIMT